MCDNANEHLQVVHLYQELRRLMGDNFMVKELNSQDPKDCILQGMQPYQALSPADEQARQQALAEQPSALKVCPSPLPQLNIALQTIV